MARMLSDWIELPVTGGFDLSRSTYFLRGYGYAGVRAGGNGPYHLRLAFAASPSWRAVGAIAVQTKADAPIQVRVNAEPADVWDTVRHVRRILTVDVDGSGFGEVARRDHVVGELRANYAGVRPVLFNSPYEAACWAVIAQRLQRAQACDVRLEIARTAGELVSVPAGGEVPGQELAAFPDPRRMLNLERCPVLPDVKKRRLRIIAEAALNGDLEAERLRAMPVDDALRALSRLPGIGPYSAQLVLQQGAGHPDVFPDADPRLQEDLADAYSLTNPSVADLVRLAEPWRPYRSWVSALVRMRGDERSALPRVDA